MEIIHLNIHIFSIKQENQEISVNILFIYAKTLGSSSGIARLCTGALTERRFTLMCNIGNFYGLNWCVRLKFTLKPFNTRNFQVS